MHGGRDTTMHFILTVKWMKLIIKENQINLILKEILKEEEVSTIRESLKEIILSVAKLCKLKLSGLNNKIAEDSLENSDILEKISKILSDKRINIISDKMEEFGIKNAYNRIINNKDEIEYFINSKLKELGKEKNFKIFIEIE